MQAWLTLTSVNLLVSVLAQKKEPPRFHCVKLLCDLLDTKIRTYSAVSEYPRYNTPAQCISSHRRSLFQYSRSPDSTSSYLSPSSRFHSDFLEKLVRPTVAGAVEASTSFPLLEKQPFGTALNRPYYNSGK